MSSPIHQPRSPRMSKCLPYSLALSLALVTSACGSPMKTPDIKHSPNPKMRYEITVSIKDAPGAFDTVQASAAYDVDNPRCVPLSEGSGATLTPEKSVPVALTRSSDNVYRGVVYLDLLHDEDYYDLGVCHWKMTSVSAYLGVGKLTMTPVLPLEDVLSQTPRIQYFSNRSYALSGVQRVDTGNARRTDFEGEADQTFSISLAAKEAFP